MGGQRVLDQNALLHFHLAEGVFFIYQHARRFLESPWRHTSSVGRLPRLYWRTPCPTTSNPLYYRHPNMIRFLFFLFGFKWTIFYILGLLYHSILRCSNLLILLKEDVSFHPLVFIYTLPFHIIKLKFIPDVMYNKHFFIITENKTTDINCCISNFWSHIWYFLNIHIVFYLVSVHDTSSRLLQVYPQWIITSREKRLSNMSDLINDRSEL